jgi:hypothetical protein
MAYSLVQPKSQIPNIRHNGNLSIGIFKLMMKKLRIVHPINVLLASVVHGISCLFVNNVINSSKMGYNPGLKFD